ncbi:MAG: hypothetical protein GY943_09550 [Chloroflexi bacterium]|nr:hypothetical protein [Chloroflexota bacterium]
MKVTFHARFGIGGGAGDCPTDHNSGSNATSLPDNQTRQLAGNLNGLIRAKVL